jgi:hypothetical protein
MYIYLKYIGIRQAHEKGAAAVAAAPELLSQSQ